MSKLDELIAKYCPNGVEYRKLGEVAKLQRGTSITKASAIIGDVPVVSGGKEPAFFCNKSNRKGDIITVAGSGAGAGYVQYWTIPIFANDCFTVQGNAEIKTKYIYYFLATKQTQISSAKKGGGVPHVHISDIDSFLIPVPPMEVQSEIVHILDNFTELTARKKQYEFYRDFLFVQYENAQKRKLMDFADISRGVRVVKKDLVVDGKFPVFQNCLNPMGYYTKSNCVAESTYIISVCP